MARRSRGYFEDAWNRMEPSDTFDFLRRARPQHNLDARATTSHLHQAPESKLYNPLMHGRARTVEELNTLFAQAGLTTRERLAAKISLAAASKIRR